MFGSISCSKKGATMLYIGDLAVYHVTCLIYLEIYLTNHEADVVSEAISNSVTHHHPVPSAPSRSAVMDLHLLRSCAILIHSPDFILVHSLMLSAHVSRYLPLLPFPLIFPSSSNLWLPSILQNKLAFFFLSFLLAYFLNLSFLELPRYFCILSTIFSLFSRRSRFQTLPSF